MTVKVCARCGKRFADPSQRVYSHFTRVYFCASFDVCAKRSRRRKNAKATA